MRLNKRCDWLVLCAGMLACCGVVSHAEPLLGRAIIASLQGDARYEWQEGSEALEEGMALTHGHRLVTANESSLCALLTPGALVCVYANTEMDIETLEHTAAGLPGSDTPALRRIGLRLGRGAILVHAGEPASDRQISVMVGNEIKVISTGGSFTLANERGTRTIDVEKGLVTIAHSGKSETLEAGGRMTIQSTAGGQWEVSTEREVDSPLPYDFEVCRRFFAPLGPMTFDWEWDNMAGVNDWIEPAGSLQYVGVPREWQDVSPSLRRTSQSEYPSSMTLPPLPGGAGQWRRPEIWDWYRRVGSLRGVNYLPRTAVNPIQMWQADTFDTKTIDQELGWAHDVDLDSVRVFVPYVVWADDAKGLKDRMEAFLDLADDHALSTVFVLFDDRQADRTNVRAGEQPLPVPGVHNSRWTASPGHALVPESAGEWPRLKEYVQDLVKAFGDDKRVLMWDLYNEAGHSGMGKASIPLVEAAFEWAREVEPDQPVTAGIGRVLPEEARQAIMKLSDVITLADYESAHQMRAMLSLAGTRGRPVICTGWLRRGQGNTFKDMLPVFAEFGVGWYHWGLVQGRSQLYMPWDSKAGAPQPDVWEQDLLDADGEPLDEEEIKLIRGFTFDAM